MLAGRRILVTRPADEALALADALRAQGAVPVSYPALEIEIRRDPGTLAALRAAWSAETLIFVSPSAVRCSFALLAAAGLPSAPPAAVCVGIGAGTARALADQGVVHPVAPTERQDSEGVAALPALAALAGRRVGIIGGEGGRRLLDAELAGRGARVERVECYRRCAPRADPGPLLADWRRLGMDAVLVTSSEGARHLWEGFGSDGQALWQQTASFVPHPRIGEALRRLGLRHIVTTGAGDAATIQALIAFFR